MKDSNRTILLLLLILLPQVASFRFSISGNPSCDGSPFQTSGVVATCSNSCEPGDTVTVSGNVRATAGFDDRATVKLQPCVSGPASVVSYWCYDPQDTGGICDWVSSPSVSCGEAATDYAIYKEITIPQQAEELESRFGSFLTIKVNAIIDGEEECGASYNSYGAAFVGVALLVGFAVRVRKRRVAEDEGSTVYVEMSDTSNGVLA